MSWQKNYSSLAAFRSDEPSEESVEFSEGPAEQWAVARKAVAELIASGKIGGEDKDYAITLSGHANPGHEPAKGQMNDCINIYIHQKCGRAWQDHLNGDPK